MTSDQPPQPDRSAPPGAGQAWSALGYLMGGIAVWGGVGWLVDRWLGAGGIVTAIGVMVGVAGGVYLVLKRLGQQ